MTRIHGRRGGGAHRWRWWAATALAFVLLAALVAAGGRFVVRHYGPALARERLEAELAAALDRPVRIGAVALRPWLVRLELDRVAIAAGPAWSDGTLLAIERVRVSADLASLWRRELLTRVVLDGVALRAELGGEGALALPASIPARFDLGPVAVAVRALEVRRGSLVVRDPATARVLTAGGLEVTATPSGGGLAALARADTLAVTGAALDETAEALRARLELRGERLVISDFRARFRGQDIRVAGEVDGLGGDATLALTVEGALPLPWLGARLGLGLPLGGVLTARAVVEGPASAPSAAADVHVPELRAGAVDARAVAGRLSWRQDRLDVTDLRADAFGGRLTGTVRWAPRAPATSTAEIRVDGAAIERLAALAGAALGVQGRITAEGELQGDPRNWAQVGQPIAGPAPDVRGRLRVIEARVTLPGHAAKLGTGTVRGELRVRDGAVAIVGAEAHWPGMAARASAGRVDTAGADALTLAATGEVGQLGRLFGAPAVAGRATLDVTLRGAWRAPVVEGQARARELRIGDALVRDASIDFDLRGRTARVARATATLGATRAEASGVLRSPATGALDLGALREQLALAIDVRAAPGRLEDLAPWLPEDWRGHGAFTLDAHVDGSLAAWRARGEVTGGPLEVRGERVEALAARVDATAARVDVPRLVARVREVPLRASATWTREGGATVRGDAGPVALAALAGVPPHLRLEGAATARGEGEWRDGRWSGAATIEARKVRAGGVRLGDGTVALAASGPDLTATVRFPEARIAAKATAALGRDTPVVAHVTFTAFDLAPLLARLPAIPPPVAPLRGAVSGTADLAVPLDAPDRTRATVRLDAIDLVAAGQTWAATAPAVIHREAGSSRVERLALRSAAGTLTASGSIADDGRLALAVDGRMSLAPLAHLRPEVRSAEGTLEAALTLGGTTTTPDARGRARVLDGRLTLRDTPHPLTDVQADLALTPGRVRVTGGRASILGSEITVAGDIAFAPAVRLDLAVRGAVPLATLASLRPEIAGAEGTLRVDARVRGTPARPEPVGEATVHADYLRLRDHATPLRDVRARLRASATRLAVTEATATVGGGTVRSEGGVALENFVPGAYAFTIAARQVRFEPSPDLTTVWDADLELVGAGRRARLHGRARLVRGAWIRETPLLRALLERGPPEPPPSGDGVGLAIRLDLGERLVVRTAVARLRARGTLDLQGTTDHPVVFGTVEAVDGHVVFRGHRFALSRASARFLDPRRLDPVLDVQGATRIGAYDVRLQVSGRTEELEIRLSSTPPLPEEDLLSLVAFGATRADLGKGGASLVAGEVAGLLLKDLLGVGGDGGLGPVDTFEIKTTEGAGRAVEVGKRVGDRSTLTYSQGIDDTSERRLRVEYELIGPVLIAGEQDFRGGFGADVLLRFRFR